MLQRGRERAARRLPARPAADVAAAIEAAPPGTVCEKCGERFVPKDGSAALFCPECLPAPDRAPLPYRGPIATPASVDVVEARDHALLAFIDRNDGLAMISQLRAALPKGDPANADGTRDEAVRHALTRLRLKGLISRTGDVWGRVGIGMRDRA